MLVLRNADGFRDTVRALRSIDGSKGVNFHAFCPGGSLCNMLIKNLG